MKILSSFRTLIAFSGAVLFLGAETSVAGAMATWSASPTSTDWNVNGNWVPAMVPDGRTSVANFATSALPQVELFGNHSGGPLVETVAQITFMPGASAYTITAQPYGAVDFEGAGVVNQSGIQQNFRTETADGSFGVGQFFFGETASAGSNLNLFTNGQTVTGGGGSGDGGACQFNDQSTAGNAIFVNEGGSLPDAGGGATNFYFNSTAGSAKITNEGATAEGSVGGSVDFQSESTAAQCVIVNNGAENTGGGGQVLFEGTSAGSAQITNNGGTVSGAGGGAIVFSFSGNAESATITNNGGTVAGAHGGVLSFVDTSSANKAVLVANGGTNGGEGAQIIISENATAREAQFKVYGNGSLDISGLHLESLRAGSIEGDGLVFLGAKNLAVGLNNLNTTFSGTIMDGGVEGGAGGTLTKLGRGLLVLGGASTYTGGTTISSGTLRASNIAGSATGTGPVTLSGGLLGGAGVIGGTVTVNSPATIAPSNGAGKSATLTIQGALTFNSGSTYKWTVKSNKATADKIVAKGVVIAPGALFTPAATGSGSFSSQTVVTVINNTSVSALNGTFANLADGAVIAINGASLKADYQGGDGNDLTLTVQ